MQEKLKLAKGETVAFVSSRSRGFASETDVSEYNVLDADGEVIGTVVFTEHTAVRGFRVTNTVVQKDAQGNVLVSETWNP